MSFARLVLVASALAFAGVGIVFLVHPGPLLERLGIVPTRPVGLTDVRAVYGGLQLAIASALLAAATRPAWVRPAVVVQVLLFAGLLAGRMVGLALDGVPEAPGPLLAALEGAALAAGLAAAWRLRRRRTE